jgi:hypothetical protein
MDQDSRDKVFVVAQSLPGLMLHLLISYLRLKRAAVRAERNLYHSLKANGIPKRQARELAASYTEWTSLRFWLKRAAFPAALDGIRASKR